jgi:hypothetical protein
MSMKIIEPIPVTDATLVSTNVAEADYAVYVAGTTYAKDAMVIITTGVHRIYKSAVAGNVGHYPPDNPYDGVAVPATGYWIDMGATNARRMFDGKSRAATTNANSVSVVITPGKLFNSLAILGLDAGSVAVSVTDPVAGLVYSATVDLYDYYGVTYFYEWAFRPIVRKPTVILLDLPAYPAATITVTASNAGSTVSVGELIIGTQKEVGTLQYGYSIGLEDYSTKEKDTDGNATLVEKSYSEPISYTLIIDSSQVYDVKRMLGSYRATPIVFIGYEENLESIVYGWISDYKFQINGLLNSILSIEVKELN